jgi:hypothetical protein
MAQGYIFPLFIQTANKTIANSAVETSLIDSGVGQLTLPANSLTVGKTIRIELLGFHSSVSNANVTVNIKIGSVTVLTTGTNSGGNSSNELIRLEALITCRTTGATGTVIGQGIYSEAHTGGVDQALINTATSTIDTTASNTIDVTFQWGTASASNTITSTNLVISMIN